MSSTSKPNKSLIPNTCPVPNVLLDTVMAQVTHAEFKVLMAIVRKTYGWHKKSDRISLDQLIKLTGVSNRKVIDAVRALAWIINTKKLPGGQTVYSINLAATMPPNCELTSQLPVNSVHTQKTLSKDSADEENHRIDIATSTPRKLKSTENGLKAAVAQNFGRRR